MINNVVLQGRLTRDPELKTTPSGVSVLTFDIANDRAYSKGTEKKTDFYSVVAWRNTAEFIARNFCKGQMIGVTGHLQTSEYTDREGNRRKAVEIVADNVDFMGDKRADSINVAPAQKAPETPEFEPLDFSDDLPF